MAQRMYDLVAINEKTGAETKLNGEPLTHAEACVVKSKFSSHPARRVQLKERPAT